MTTVSDLFLMYKEHSKESLIAELFTWMPHMVKIWESEQPGDRIFEWAGMSINSVNSQAISKSKKMSELTEDEKKMVMRWDIINQNKIKNIDDFNNTKTL